MKKATSDPDEKMEFSEKSEPSGFMKKAGKMATAKEAKHDGKKAMKKPARKR